MNSKLLVFISALVLIGIYSGLRPSPSLAVNNPSCSSYGGVCKASCSSGESKQSPTNCDQTSLHNCCIPPPAVNNPSCSSYGGVCKASCSSGESKQSPTNCDQTSLHNCCIPPNGSTSSNTAFCDGDVTHGVNTAIGCLMAGDPKQLISQLLGWGVAVGGGIAFLMIVLAGFQMATASGDPKKVQAARELLMSALAGLIIIVLSVVLLNFIGVKILNLPGFVGNPNLNL